MKTVLQWIEGMKFQASADSNTIVMDAKAPIGHNLAMTPKELVAAGLGGCTSMDVIALLKKHKQKYSALQVEVDIEVSKGTVPSTFTHAMITFSVDGEVEPQILLEAVHLSQTRYCGVSAMLLKAFPIEYKVILNKEVIGQGHADFGG